MLDWIRRRRKLVLCLLAPVLGCAVAELGLRWLLFGSSPLAVRWGAALRQPLRFADPATEDYWILSQRWLGEPGPLPAELFDAQLGWIAPEFRRAGWVHEDEASLGGRRPVLVFGDSFARGPTRRGQRFQALLEETELAATHRLINYGVGAYGPDQVLLLMREVLPRWRERDPFVLIVLCLDDSVDRALIGFRGWPKPRLGEDLEPAAGPGGLASLDEYLRAHEPSIPLYAVAAIARGGLLPVSWRAKELDRDPRWRADACATTERVLTAMHAELERASVEHAFVLCEGPRSLWRRGASPWRVAAAEDALVAAGAPFVCATPLLLEDALRRARSRGDYFVVGGRERDHLDGAGQRTVLPALTAAIRGRLPPGARRKPMDARAFETLEEPPSSIPTVAWSRGSRAAGEPVDPERLLLRPRSTLSARALYRLDGRARRFTARACARTADGSGVPRSLGFVARIDGRAPIELVVDASGRELELDLAGARVLSLAAHVLDTGSSETLLELVEPRFE